MKALIAVIVAAVLAAAAAIAFVLMPRSAGGPDAFAGTYPPATPLPTPSETITWRPAGRPAGPLPTFPGQHSKVTGRITDRAAGISYVKFAEPPWRIPGGFSGGHTAGQEITSKKKDYKDFWYLGVYSGPLRPEYDLPGANRLRAAAELVGRHFVQELYPSGGDRKEIAGAAMTVDGHAAWVHAFRMTRSGNDRVVKSQTEVVLVVKTGGRRPAVLEMTVPNNQDRLLPDVNTVIRSVRVL